MPLPAVEELVVEDDPVNNQHDDGPIASATSHRLTAPLHHGSTKAQLGPRKKVPMMIRIMFEARTAMNSVFASIGPAREPLADALRVRSR